MVHRASGSGRGTIMHIGFFACLNGFLFFSEVAGIANWSPRSL